MRLRIAVAIFLALFTVTTVHSQNTYKEITLIDLMKKKKAGDPNMVIVDVRSRGEYGDTMRSRSGNIGRIRGAVNIPLNELMSDSTAIHRFDAYRDKDIYLICSHSYRSRTVSNMLLKNGFTHVNNTRGAMTEWYRRFDELKDYRTELDQEDVRYKNLAPAELLRSLDMDAKPLLVGVQNNARMVWDSGNLKLFRNFPVLKGTLFFHVKDSLLLLQEAMKSPGRPIVLFSMVNSGAAEMADWLTGKGIKNASYLVGGLTLTYEYSLDHFGKEKTASYFQPNSSIDFITPLVYCSNKAAITDIVDLRDDSLFNKISEGVKHNFSHLKEAKNFPFAMGADRFIAAFSRQEQNLPVHQQLWRGWY
jgi:rhodanese-related sulfurtransferase